MSFIGSIGDLFAGLGDVGKLIGEGKFMDAFLKLGESLGKFFLDSINNLFTFGAKLFGMEFAEGETIFSKIADGFRNIITDYKWVLLVFVLWQGRRNVQFVRILDVHRRRMDRELLKKGTIIIRRHMP